MRTENKELFMIGPVSIAVILIVGYFVYDVVKAYCGAVGSLWSRLVAGMKTAAASMWTGFTVAVTAIVGLAAQTADLVNAPSVATALQTYGDPKYVAAVMITAAFLTELTRRLRD
jgi:uncharacterized membrane protein YuzA (DUF378 family)